MPRIKKTKQEKPEKKVQESTAKKNFTYAVGKRKESVAVVRLYSNGNNDLKKGEILVNSRKIEEYFPSLVQKAKIAEILSIANAEDKFVFEIKVKGGGIESQLDALILGISRALSAFDSEKYKSILRKKGFLTRDSRIRQRRKVGMGGKSRRKRQSPKR